MSVRFSFIHDYYPVREALMGLARAAVNGATRHTAASGEALQFAQEVRVKIQAMHAGLLETMTCSLAPPETLRLKFEAQIAEIYAALPEMPEVTVAPMQIADVETSDRVEPRELIHSYKHGEE